MTDCLDKERPEQLARLLSGDLPETEQSRLAEHLEACASCRETLESMAAESDLWNDLTLLKGHPIDSPVGCGSELDRSDDDEIPLGILEPAEDATHLGKLGPYRIIRVIGRGGMGVVFQGHDGALDRLVAIKVLVPGMAATGAARRRFAREAKAAAAVVHEHVVTIHAVDITPQGIPYLVMQLIAGKSVQDLIDQDRQPSLQEILRIGSQTARGLAAAHAQGLIHRDIKPANILLENGVERVKITDFGLARAVDDATMTQSGIVAGTPRYMSPEQARGDLIDCRTDLFSLGSVLYALCTGRAPFGGNSSMATLKRVCDTTPEPIRSINPMIPAWLVKIITRLHAKDPSERYPTALEVAELLGKCLAHVEEPTSIPLPAELLPVRNRRRVAAATLVSLCTLFAVSLSLSNVRAAAMQAAEYVATVLRIKTPEGVLVIETDDPNVGIKLDGSELVVTGAGVKELRVPVGPHSVQTVKDGKVVQEELVTITRGGRASLKVSREKEGWATANGGLRANPSPSMAEMMGPSSSEPTDAGGRVRGSDRNLAKPVQRIQRKTDSEWNSHGPKARYTEVVPMRSEVRSIAFSPDGKYYAYGSKDGWIGLTGPINEANGGLFVQRQAPFEAHSGGVESVAFSPDGNTLASAGWDHHVRLWDVSRGLSSTKLIWGYGGHSKAVRSIAFSPDGDLLVAGSLDHTFTVLNAKTGQAIWTSPYLDQPINGVGFSPDGQLIALALGDYTKGTVGDTNGQPGQVHLWNWPGRSIVTSLHGWKRECKTVAFSSNGQTLAATSGDGTTRLYYTGIPGRGIRGGESAILNSGPFTAGAAFHPFSNILATSNWSGEVRLWDTANQSMHTSFQATDANIPCLAFTPDGRILATAGADGSIKLWDYSAVFSQPGQSLNLGAAAQVSALANALKASQPRRGSSETRRMRLYMRDLVDGGVTLIADEPAAGISWSSSGKWSDDGQRIAFNAVPANSGLTQSQMFVLEARDGKAVTRSIGAGNCPVYSPDNQQIAFFVWPGSAEDLEGGVWLMNADGSERRRLSDAGSPFWSSSGDWLMINHFNFSDLVNRCSILNMKKRRESNVVVAGHKLFSWSRWITDTTIVAIISANKDDEQIVVLDVHNPAQANVVKVLWTRGPELNVTPRWPLFRASTGQLYFVGVEPGNMRNLYEVSPGQNGRAIPMQPRAYNDGLGSLELSPDDRYLLYGANRAKGE